MTHTLVAAFDTLAEAQAAKADLLIQQVLVSNIHLSSAPGKATDNPIAAGVAGHSQDDTIGYKISQFFSSLFGNDEEDKPHRYAVAYPEAYRRGATLLTVTAISDEQADRIEDILERNGAIDIDERSASWSTDDSDIGATTHLAGSHQGIDRSEAVERNLYAPVGQAALPARGDELLVGKSGLEGGRARGVSRVPERSQNQPADVDIEADPSWTVQHETFTPTADKPKNGK